MSNPHVCCAVEHGIACCAIYCTAITTLTGSVGGVAKYCIELVQV